MTRISIMSGLALRGAFEKSVLQDFSRDSGIETEVRWGPTTVLVDDIAHGAVADVAVLTDVAIDQLVKKGVIEPAGQVTVAQAVLGIAVRRGDPLPDISTTKAFVKTLLGVRSVAFSRGGASGIYFSEMIDRLAIGDRIREKATIIPAGFTAEMLVTGQADIAVQQISELVVVPGVEIVGEFPEELQSATTFRAAAFKGAAQAQGAARFIQSLVTHEAKNAYRAAGLIAA